MTVNFEGRVALVTGAAVGIGFATARAFAEAGASVVLTDNDDSALEQAHDQLLQYGATALALVCDVTNVEQVSEMVDRTVSRFGRLDAAFNNAGINSQAVDMHETSDEAFEQILNVNLRGVWNCMKAQLPTMLTQGHGAIVNCSSIGGLKGSKGRSAYSASKHAVIGLTRSAALEYAPRGIRINAICPGMIKTPMAAVVTNNFDAAIMEQMVAREPIGRFGEPEEIAAAVLWMCSPDSSFMTGHAMAVDGGILAG